MIEIHEDPRVRLRILDGLAAAQDADTFHAAAGVLVQTATDLVPNDHCAYTEMDPYFDGNVLWSSSDTINDWALKRSTDLAELIPDHPGLRFRLEAPDVPTFRLSDVTDMHSFYRSRLYNDLLRETDTRFQLSVQFGFDPGQVADRQFRPVAFGLTLNRSGSDFTGRDLAALAALRRVARPVILQKRSAHLLRLLDGAELTPEVRRMLLGHGLTDRQAEVAFWMIKGKSNTDIATILDIGPDTVRHHSMSIFRRLGADGRLALQRALILSVTGD